jgi:hypothetical protein
MKKVCVCAEGQKELKKCQKDGFWQELGAGVRPTMEALLEPGHGEFELKKVVVI